MGDSDGFQLLSAVRYDTDRPWQSLLELPLKEPLDRSSPILLVSYHRDRMASAGDAFGWPEAVTKLRSPSISQDIISLAEESILKDGSSRLTGAYKVLLVHIETKVYTIDEWGNNPRYDLWCIPMAD